MQVAKVFRKLYNILFSKLSFSKANKFQLINIRKHCFADHSVYLFDVSQYEKKSPIQTFVGHTNGNKFFVKIGLSPDDRYEIFYFDILMISFIFQIL